MKWTDTHDELIRAAYFKQRFPAAYLARLPEFSTVSKDAIRSHAGRIGARGVRSASRKPLAAWEKELILSMSEYSTPKQIIDALRRRGSERAYQTITGFLRREGAQVTDRPPDLYNLCQISEGFRCARDTIKRWVRKGLLKASNVGDEHKWSFKPIAVARFIIDHPFELEGCRPDIPWVVSLITEFHGQLKRRD